MQILVEFAMIMGYTLVATEKNFDDGLGVA